MAGRGRTHHGCDAIQVPHFRARPGRERRKHPPRKWATAAAATSLLKIGRHEEGRKRAGGGQERRKEGARLNCFRTKNRIIGEGGGCVEKRSGREATVTLSQKSDEESY